MISHDETTTPPSVTAVDDSTIRRATIAGAIGSFVEWYDYGIYGLLTTYLALNIMGGAESASLFLTNVGFLVSFIARPFGSVICGYLGDRMGRRQLLATLLILIATATTCIGLIPHHSVIGVGGPIILVCLRVLQGFSAGGEVAGAMSFVGEYARDEHRNASMAWIAVGSFAALTFGSLFSAFLITVLGDDSMSSWGWRIPFLLAGPFGYIGFYIRRRMEETPQFQALKQEKKVARNPLKDAFTNPRHLRAIILTIFLPAVNGPGYYLLFAYMPAYLKTSLGEHNFTMLQALLVNVCGLTAVMICIPLMARLSDRIGRRPVLLISAVAMALMSYPMFTLITTGQMALAAIGAAVMAVCFSGTAATIHTVLLEMFPTSVRYSAYSIGFSLSTIIFGGSAPLIMTEIIAHTGNSMVPAFASILSAVISLISIHFVKETKGLPLDLN